MLHTGDCVEVMAGMDAESIGAVVTDPPYGLEFMGKDWDRRPPHEVWAREALRVARPGAYLLAFGGTRTYHRLACAIEDAGWIIRDCLVWAYASGFPKSKALLKPAWEPIVMARKPGPLRDLAIDACRIPHDEPIRMLPDQHGDQPGTFYRQGGRHGETLELKPNGRWPANVVLTDPIFDGDTPGVVGGGDTGPAGTAVRRNGAAGGSNVRFGSMGAFDVGTEDVGYGDSGTYSRFFLVPKSARSEREPILRGNVPTVTRAILGQGSGGTDNLGVPRENTHPTVKPLDLMRHLVRLVTPAGGTVLDPFLGSGTTALAAEMEGFGWVGIEREPEYVAIAEARLNGIQRGLGI